MIVLERAAPSWARLGEAIRAWRSLAPLRHLEDFGFPADAENPLEEPNVRLRRFGGGVEAWVFLAEGDGTVYKFYRPMEGATKCVGSSFGFRGGEDHLYHAEARPGSYRDLFEKLLLVDALGGMPTEVAAVTPEGIVVVRQALGDQLPQGDDVSRDLPAGLVEIPSRFLRANRDHPRLFLLAGKPYLVGDFHARNFVRSADGSLRVIDLVAAPWPGDADARVSLITDWLARVAADPEASALPSSPDDEL